jgi:hypothetical protein
LATDSFRGDRVNWILFLSISIAGFLMRLACTTGLIGTDDLLYAHYVKLVSSLHYTPEPIHYALRYGLLVPAGIIYRLLGVHEWTTYLLPLIASAASVPLLMILGARLVGLRAALLAGVLLASFPVSLLYSTILVPEPIAGFYILIALLVYIGTDTRRPLFLGLSAGLILGISYLTKESAAFVALAVFLDAALRRRWTVACGIGAGMCLIVAAEHAYYLASTGDLLFRFHSMKFHEQTPMVLAANENLKYRLFKSYPRLMLIPSEAFGVHSMFALATMLAVLKWRPQRVQFLLLWAAVPWLYLNFGSSSLSHFTALPTADRYVELCYPPLFLLAGWILDRWMTQQSWAMRPVLACVALIAAVGLWCGYAEHQQGWHTDDVAILRRIADSAHQKHLSSVRFVDDPDKRWQEMMGILAPGLRPVNENAQPDLVIGPDALGLPSAMPASSVAARPLQ